MIFEIFFMYLTVNNVDSDEKYLYCLLHLLILDPARESTGLHQRHSLGQTSHSYMTNYKRPKESLGQKNNHTAICSKNDQTFV